MNTPQNIQEWITMVVVCIGALAYIFAKINNLLFLLRGKSKKDKLILILKTLIKSSSWLLHWLEQETNVKEIKKPLKPPPSHPLDDIIDNDDTKKRKN